ncbi:unnamed protein product [Dicrocoelium dendriticum]|nr:unnamed protein product [Dicrocoelium dendriticum]
MGEIDSLSDHSEIVWHLRTSSHELSPSPALTNFLSSNSSENRTASEIPVFSSEVAVTSNSTCVYSAVPSIHPTFSRLLRSVYWSKTRATADAPPLQCTVLLLDDHVVVYDLQNGANGCELFQLVAEHLKLEEPDHFGLTYHLTRSTGVNPVVTLAPHEPGSPTDASSDGIRQAPRRIRSKRVPLPCRSIISPCDDFVNFSFTDGPFWLKLDQKIFDQCHSCTCSFCFEVKFYVPHPERSIDCLNTRRQYYLQLRRHLSTGRLQCSFHVRVFLGALIAQMDLGDFHPRHSLCLDSLSVPHLSITNDYPPGKSISSAESRSLLSSRTCSLASPEHSDEEPETVWDYRSNLTSNCVYEMQSAQPLTNTMNFDSGSISHHDYSAILPYFDQRFHAHTLTSTSDEFPASLAGARHRIRVSWPYPRPTKSDAQAILRHVARAHRKLQ